MAESQLSAWFGLVCFSILSRSPVLWELGLISGIMLSVFQKHVLQKAGGGSKKQCVERWCWVTHPESPTHSTCGLSPSLHPGMEPHFPPTHLAWPLATSSQLPGMETFTGFCLLPEQFYETRNRTWGLPCSFGQCFITKGIRISSSSTYLVSTGEAGPSHFLALEE